MSKARPSFNTMLDKLGFGPCDLIKKVDYIYTAYRDGVTKPIEKKAFLENRSKK